MYKIFEEAVSMKNEAEIMLNYLNGACRENDIYIDLACKTIIQAEIIIEAYRQYASDVRLATPKVEEIIKEKETFKNKCVVFLKRNVLNMEVV